MAFSIVFPVLFYSFFVIIHRSCYPKELDYPLALRYNNTVPCASEQGEDHL